MPVTLENVDTLDEHLAVIRDFDGDTGENRSNGTNFELVGHTNGDGSGRFCEAVTFENAHSERSVKVPETKAEWGRSTDCVRDVSTESRAKL